jgi:hypothetical protein
MRLRTASLVTCTLAILLLLGLAASASAESPGLDQYVETIPGGGGDHATRDGNDKDDNGGGGSGGSDSGGSMPGPTVDSSQLDALRSQGEAGRRAADVLEASSNVRDDGAGGPGSAEAGSAAHQSPPLDSSEAEGEAPVEAILSSMFGGASGALLPIIMLAVLVGGLVIAARTRAGSIDD